MPVALVGIEPSSTAATIGALTVTLETKRAVIALSSGCTEVSLEQEVEARSVWPPWRTIVAPSRNH